MKKKFTFSRICTLLVPLLLGSIAGLLLKQDFSYIESIQRRIHIPSLIFPIVWSFLYILFGIYKDNYNRDEKKKGNLEIPYYLSLLFNYVFSFLLFLFHKKILALIDIIVLISLIGYLFVTSFKEKKKYSYLLIPYLFWLFIALILMIDLFFH